MEEGLQCKSEPLPSLISSGFRIKRVELDGPGSRTLYVPPDTTP